MKCNRSRKHLLPYAEGRLSKELVKPLEEHLAVCESCAQELGELAQTVNVLRQTEYPAMEPASDLRSRVMAGIAREPAATRARPWWAGKLPAYSAAAASLLILAVLLAGVTPFLSRSRHATPPSSDIKGQHGRLAEEPDLKRGMPSPAPTDGDRMLESDAVAKGARVPAPTQAQNGVIAGRDWKYPAKPTGSSATEDFETENGFHMDSRLERQKKDGVAPGTATDTAHGEELRGSRGPAVGGKLAPPGQAGSPFDKAGSGVKGTREVPVPEGHAAERAQADLGGTAQFPSETYSVSAPSRSDGMKELLPGIGNACRPREELSAAEIRALADNTLVLETKLREFPNSRTVLLALLLEYRDAGRVEDECAVAERLTKLCPENARYWFARGEAAERNRMPRTGEACYRRAIELNLGEPDLDAARNRLKALEAEGKD